MSLVIFTQKMLELNQTLNLTRWITEEEVLTFHILDSAQCLPVLQEIQPLPAPHSYRWMDLGSGCGFPGAILAAVHPHWEVTFLDSVTKKIKALNECVKPVGWNTSLLACRAEELGKNPNYRSSWNGITARAVADFRVVLEYAIPLLIKGGFLVNWLTDDQIKIVDKSERVLTELRSKVLKSVSYKLPNQENRRWIVIVEKLGTTPEIYPRSIGKALKKPLI